MPVDEGKEAAKMSRNDELFCAQVAQVTNAKKLPAVRKEKIRSLVKAMTVGTLKRGAAPKKK
jgi:hypothetical protein